MDSLEERLLTAPEVSAILRCSVSGVYALAKAGELPVVRIGRLRRFPSAQNFSLGRAGVRHPADNKGFAVMTVVPSNLVTRQGDIFKPFEITAKDGTLAWVC